MSISIVRTIKCKDHPKYKALRKPRVSCEACAALFRKAAEMRYPGGERFVFPDGSEAIKQVRLVRD